MPKPTGGPQANQDGTHPAGGAGQQGPPSPAAGSEYAEAISGMLGGAKGGPPPSEAPRRSRGGGMRGVGAVALVALAAVAVWNVYDYYLRPVPPPPAEAQRRAGQIMLFNAVQAIEAERTEEGALPRNLGGLILPRGNFEYVLADTGYTLRLTLSDVVLSHRSGDDVQQLLRGAGVH